MKEAVKMTIEQAKEVFMVSRKARNLSKATLVFEKVFLT
jgi:hypothetical protein